MNPSDPPVLNPDCRVASGHQVVFIGGLHRSGTSLLASTLQEHPMISGFRNTGASEDEGQHLQHVYPPVRAHGGPGRFAFEPRAHLTEKSELVSPTSANRLFEQWSHHWDLTMPVLVEKSPPNLLQTRFLQAMFHDTAFIMLLRHPLVVALATQHRAGRQSIRSLLHHWFRAHQIFLADASKLDRLLVVRYEELLIRPDKCLERIADFIGIEPLFPSLALDPEVTQGYRDEWSRRSRSRVGRARSAAICKRFEADAGRFGYSMFNLDRCDPFNPNMFQ